MAAPSFETNFFRIAGTSEAETSVSGKAECLLSIGKDKKSKLFEVTFSFKIIIKRMTSFTTQYCHGCGRVNS